MKKWILEQAINDILDSTKCWSELSRNELKHLILKEFKNKDNWFFDDTKWLERDEVYQIVDEWMFCNELIIL